MPPKAVIYCRVATFQQLYDTSALHTQASRCRAYAAHRRLDVRSVHADAGAPASAPLEERPGLRSAVEALAESDILIVTDIERITREPGPAREAIFAAIGERGASIASVAADTTYHP